MRRIVASSLLVTALTVGGVAGPLSSGGAAPAPTEPAAVDSTTASVGAQLIRALAARDFDAARDKLAPSIEFRGFTPTTGFLVRTHRASLMNLLREWYATAETIETLRDERVLARRQVSYRIRWASPGGPMVFAQHVFYDTDASGRIERMHLVCSGDQAAGR